MVERPIRFFHRGQIVEVAGTAPTRTVLQWLREDAHCTGTKEGCNEGDCGACTVVVAELADRGTPATTVGGLSLRPVNACIQFLPTLDGRALLTVEDLQGIAGGRLHPVQQALVDHHGSQCGFCTPGFVMSLWAGYERHAAAGTRPSRGQLADDLAGNLCRCTGYRPILDAGLHMLDAPPVRLNAAPIEAALASLRTDGPLHYAAPNPAQVRDGQPRTDHFHAPRTLADFAALREAWPDAHILAGATDIGLWANKQFRDLPRLIYVGEVAELRRIEHGAGLLRIGAAVPLEDAWQALARHWPALAEVGLRFAGPPVRHAGTMGGNVANGSPIGDSAPVLMALGARLVLRRGRAQRTLPLDGFYTGYMRNELQRGEFVEAIEVPLGAPGAVRAYKVSKRFDCDISALCAGLWIDVAADGRVADARFAYGGMAATVRRAAGAEAAVRGQPWSEATVQAAMDALDADFTPLTDLRASAAYRRKVARNLLMRLWLEIRPGAPLAADAVSVWAGLDHAPA